MKSLTELHLTEMKKLRVLDLTNNELSDLNQVIEVINDLPHLHYIGFSGNKFSSSSHLKTYRQKLIGSILQLREVGCPLEYLDDAKIEGIRMS